MEVLFDIRTNTDFIIELTGARTMAKRYRESPEHRAERKARGAELDRRLREAIARRKAEAAKRRAQES
jgi:hypothetical protein